MKYLKEFEQALDGVIGETVTRIIEAENPNQVGGNQNSPIPGTPADLMPQPSPEQVAKKKRRARNMEKWIKNTEVLDEELNEGWRGRLSGAAKGALKGLKYGTIGGAVAGGLFGGGEGAVLGATLGAMKGPIIGAYYGGAKGHEEEENEKQRPHRERQEQLKRREEEYLRQLDEFNEKRESLDYIFRSFPVVDTSYRNAVSQYQNLSKKLKSQYTMADERTEHILHEYLVNYKNIAKQSDFYSVLLKYFNDDKQDELLNTFLHSNAFSLEDINTMYQEISNLVTLHNSLFRYLEPHE